MQEDDEDEEAGRQRQLAHSLEAKPRRADVSVFSHPFEKVNHRIPFWRTICVVISETSWGDYISW